ncbi:membrane-spanning 4-domains subfamily A member 3-like [Watersipora subatra]|uniref:membrane-spanning 4-domains subfamily A member 3-like n=1 Tax=Watersipora subatra TaxID=2589382 RepID=UPI00355C37E5
MLSQLEGIQQPIIRLNSQHNVGGSVFQREVRSQMYGLSVVQIVAGIICFAPGVVGIINKQKDYNYTGYGIWTGLYFIVVGSIGLGAAKSNTHCLTISAMVLNIIASVLCGISVIFSSFGIDWSKDCRVDSSLYYMDDCQAENEALATNAVLLAASLVELLLTIWSAVLCCKAVCSFCKPSHLSTVLYQPSTTNQMNFTTNTGGPPVIYPDAQPFSTQGRHISSTSGQLPTVYMMSPQANAPMSDLPV